MTSTAASGVRTTVYAYPWDLVDDPDAANRIAELGTDSVTVAAAYHSVRAATPQHPNHRVVHAKTAALYLPVREASWRGQRLVPADGGGWAGRDSFARARDQLADVGLSTEAWVVLTHGSSLGAQAPELCVTNAFGDVYGYALCPNNPEVIEYSATLVAEVAELADVDRITVEACGPLGVGHQSQHEKTAGADWTPEQQRHLSLCFCAGCRRDYARVGMDVEAFAVSVRAVIDSPSAGSAENDPTGDDRYSIALDRALDIRQRTIRALRDSVTSVAQAGGIDRVAFDATADRWATGPSAAVALDDGGGAAAALVAQCWAPDESSVQALRDLKAVAGSADLGAYCTILPPASGTAGDLTQQWTALIEAGATELHIYHAGLASRPRIDAAREALASITNLRPEPGRTAPAPTADRPHGNPHEEKTT